MRIIARVDLSADDGLMWADELSVSLVGGEHQPALFCLSASTPDRHRPGPDYSFVSYAPKAMPENPRAAAERIARAFDEALARDPHDLTVPIEQMTAMYVRAGSAVRLSAVACEAGSGLDMHRRLSRIHALGPEALRFGQVALSTLAENPERRFQALVAMGPFAPLLFARPELRSLVDRGLPLIPELAQKLGAAPATVRKLIRAHPRLEEAGIPTTHYDWCGMARVLTPGQNLDTPEGQAVLQAGFSVLTQCVLSGAAEREMRRTPPRHWGRVAREYEAARDADAGDYLSALCVFLIERAWGPVMMARFAPLTAARAAEGDGAALDTLREAMTGVRRGNALERRARRVLEGRARLKDLPGLSREWHAMVLRESGFASCEEASWAPLLGGVRAGDYDVNEVCSFESLENLGREQKHCVATRASAVVSAHARRADIIFSIARAGETVATAMISLRDGAWGVAEIRGARNGSAPDGAVAAASSVSSLLGEAWKERGEDYLARLRPAAALIRKHKAEDFCVVPDLGPLRALLPEGLRGLTAEDITDLINQVGPAPYETWDAEDSNGAAEQREVEAALSAVESRMRGRWRPH